MYRSATPGVSELAGMFGYVLNNPFLFISSSTVMTSAVVVMAFGLALAAWRIDALHRLFTRSAGTLALIFLYFGLGSTVLAVEILLRFHDSIPVETETQFVSGAGHLGVGLIGIAVTLPFARGRTDWTLANAVALLYWTLQLLVLDPPWFRFQGQGDLTRAVAFGSIAALTLLTTLAAAARPAGQVVRSGTTGSPVAEQRVRVRRPRRA